MKAARFARAVNLLLSKLLEHVGVVDGHSWVGRDAEEVSGLHQDLRRCNPDAGLSPSHPEGYARLLENHTGRDLLLV